MNKENEMKPQDATTANLTKLVNLGASIGCTGEKASPETRIRSMRRALKETKSAVALTCPVPGQ
ncbi:MAG: hypothetical protein AAF065_13260 [Verrucomicrobiota bacterium]